MVSGIKRWVFVGLLLTGISGLLGAQNYRVSGVVADTASAPLSGATVILMQAADSVMTSFAMSDAAGKFAFPGISSGDYLLQVSYIGFQVLWVPLELRGGSSARDLGTLLLEENIAELTTVVISGERSPLTIKKDTLEYNAAAFQTQPNAVVEDLLKQLPGMEVESDGTVKAQGETVRRVTIDGKEFFGRDPKIATKNLPADAVEKVQVFDKKSDRAEFSGIDDGQREKTINLTLKEDKKKGVFGNIKAGYGDQGRFNGRGNLNRFSPSTRLSVIGLANNTNEEGFSFEDYINFMGGIQSFMNGKGGISINLDSRNSPIPIGPGNNQGINTVYAGGANFNHELSEKTELNGNYFFSQFNRSVNRTIRRTDILNDGRSFSSDQDNRSESDNQNHRLDLTLDHAFDSLQSVRIRSSLRFTANDALSSGTSALYGVDGGIANDGQRSDFSEGDQNLVEASALYKRKLGRPGRTLSIDAGFRLSEQQQSGQLNALNRFFDGGLPGFEQRINQDRLQDEQVSQLNSSISYTEPLGRRRYLEWNYYFLHLGQDALQDVFDKVAIGSPGIRNEQLSNHYNSDYQYHKSGLRLSWNREKYNFSAGVNYQQSLLQGELLLQDTYIRQRFSNWLPTFNFDYSFDNSHNFRVFYDTRMQEPSIRELQPIVDNSDPLNLYVGNPDLQPEYQHQINGNYLFFDQFSYLNIFASTVVQYSENKIQYAQTIDEQFVRTTRPVNVSDFLNAQANLSVGTPIRPLKSRISVNLGWQFSAGPNFINGIENDTRTRRGSVSVRLDNRNKEKVDVFVSTRLRQNNASYALSDAFDQTFQDYKHSTGFTWNWSAANLQLQSNLDYFVYAGRGAGFDREVPLWNASISRFFTREKRVQVSFAVKDLLNQNLGIERTTMLNYVLDERVNALGRYMLLSVQYAVKGFGNSNGVVVRINE